MLATDPASGAINMALLDLCGKQAKVPVYQLLGGPTGNKVRALTLFDESALATGLPAFVVPISLPQQSTSRPRFVDSVVKRFEALRGAHGEDVDFVADGMGLLPSAEAADIAVALEALHPLWFAQPCRASNSEVLARLTTEFATPIDLGRAFEQVGPLLNLLRDGLIDVALRRWAPLVRPLWPMWARKSASRQ